MLRIGREAGWWAALLVAGLSVCGEAAIAGRMLGEAAVAVD